MLTLVPLHVLIGLNEKGQHDFPSFNDIADEAKASMSWPMVQVGSRTKYLDWSHYIDRFGGWHYDKQCGHVDHDPEHGTPAGMWCGMLLVPRDFAEAAVEQFPDQCTILDEEDAEIFYNDRAHAHEQDIEDDVDVLQAIAAKRAAGITDEADNNALDPDHPTRGRRRNKTKTWSGFKRQRGVIIDRDFIAAHRTRKAQGNVKRN